MIGASPCQTSATASISDASWWFADCEPYGASGKVWMSEFAWCAVCFCSFSFFLFCGLTNNGWIRWWCLASDRRQGLCSWVCQWLQAALQDRLQLLFRHRHHQRLEGGSLTAPSRAVCGCAMPYAMLFICIRYDKKLISYNNLTKNIKGARIGTVHFALKCTTHIMTTALWTCQRVTHLG